MRTRQFSLTPEQIRELQEADKTCRNQALKRRYQAVLLYGTGHSISEVTEQTGYSHSGITKICRKYEAKGIAGLYTKPTQRSSSLLTLEQIRQLRKLLRSKTPLDMFGCHSYSSSGSCWTIQDLKRLLQERYRVTFKTTSAYRNLFSRCGFVYYWKESGYLDIEQAWRRYREDNT